MSAALENVNMFCHKCGVKLVKETIEGFNPQTGARNFRMVCPTGLCFHEGYSTHDTDDNATFIESGGWFGKDYWNYRCKRCGYTKREEYIPAIY